MCFGASRCNKVVHFAAAVAVSLMLLNIFAQAFGAAQCISSNNAAAAQVGRNPTQHCVSGEQRQKDSRPASESKII